MKMVSTFDMCDECINNLISELKPVNASVKVSDHEDYICVCGCQEKAHSVTVTIDERLGKTQSYEIHFDGGCIEYGDSEWHIETDHFYIFGGSDYLFGDIAIYKKSVVKKVVITDEI